MIVRLLAFLLTIGLAAPAWAADRIALVIGNDSYTEVPRLLKARNDALAMADKLRFLGFEVLTVTDADRAEMNTRIREFESLIENGDTALIFFAGHGVEIEGENYLLPVDIPNASPGQENLIRDEAISFSQVLSRIKNTGAELSLAFLDACRNNPFQAEGTRSVGTSRGLGRIAAPGGTFVMYSAGAGETALDRLSDDDPDPNSVYTRTLLPMLSTPGLDLREMAVEVRRRVNKLAQTVPHRQTPAYYDEVLNDFSFVPEEDADGLSKAIALQETVNDYLQTLKIGTPAAWDAFLGRHGHDPANPYVVLAVALLDKLNEQPVSPLGPAPEGSQPAPVHLCDRLVANPFDPQRATDGTPWRLITPLSAREACTAALETYPDEARFQYQLARVDHFTGNFEAAIPIFEQLSNDGYVAATNNLATMYLNGEGVDLDTDEARRLFLEAAARDYAPAMNNIGWMYQASLGVEENFSEALEWYRRGADLGYATAMTNIGWMFQAAIGVERDFEEAMKWYTRAAENGNAIAMANIGWMHQNALGVAQDYAAAFEWYEEAARRGNVTAIHNIADMHRRGLGVSQDANLAGEWYMRAVRDGNSGTLNTLIDRHRDYPRDTWRAVQFVLKSAGLYSGSIDGLFGNQTRTGLVSYYDSYLN